MSSAHRYLPKYTVEDYQSWEGDWELWQGIPVSMSPSPFGRHQKLAANILAALHAGIDSANCDAVVMAEIDWIVNGNTVVRPDIVVLCGDAPERHVDSAPAIAVEVLSPSTRDRDRSAKFDLYQDEGVPYYLILDPENNTLETFKLQDGTYRALEVADDAELEICDDCKLQFNVAKIFS